VLSAVAEYHDEKSTRPFTFVEIGAGYGHWTFAAHKALQQLAPGAPHRYVMVDVVSSLAGAVKNLEVLNGIESENVSFHVGYISWRDSTTGDNNGQLRDGKKMINSYSSLWGLGAGSGDESIAKQTVTLATLLDRYDTPDCVDMVDIDIQGSECK
jgi:hypothetical protein